jgi:hypothetical protein
MGAKEVKCPECRHELTLEKPGVYSCTNEECPVITVRISWYGVKRVTYDSAMYRELVVKGERPNEPPPIMFGDPKYRRRLEWLY